jgi:hypothetical protein
MPNRTKCIPLVPVMGVHRFHRIPCFVWADQLWVLSVRRMDPCARANQLWILSVRRMDCANSPLQGSRCSNHCGPFRLDASSCSLRLCAEGPPRGRRVLQTRPRRVPAAHRDENMVHRGERVQAVPAVCGRPGLGAPSGGAHRWRRQRAAAAGQVGREDCRTDRHCWAGGAAGRSALTDGQTDGQTDRRTDGRTDGADGEERAPPWAVRRQQMVLQLNSWVRCQSNAWMRYLELNPERLPRFLLLQGCSWAFWA